MSGSAESMSTDVLIVGTGLTGLSAAYHCDLDYILVEATDEIGGTASTLHHNGFRLDRGVHILYFRDPWTRKWITDDLGVDLALHKRKSVVYVNREFVPFPLQFNLAAFPPPKRLKYGVSALKAGVGNGKARSLADWAQENFGIALAKDFFIPYNEKLWGVSADLLTTEWMDGYVPKPSVRSVMSGMVRSPSRTYGTNADFWYPKAGGIDSLAKAIAGQLGSVRYGHRLIGLDMQSRTASFSTGLSISYRKLVSTIPLQKLMHCVKNVPQEMRESQASLKSCGTTFAHILVEGPGVGGGIHWIYVPDPSIPFYRVTVPHCIAEGNCPPGWSALTLEFGGIHSQSEQLEEASKKALISMRLLEPSDVDSSVVWDSVDHGYVTYDANIAEARTKIRSWLADEGVICLGRYGRWEYSNMESAMLQGRSISIRLNGSTDGQRTVSGPHRPELRAVKRYFSESYNKRPKSITSTFLNRGLANRRRQVCAWVPQWEGLSVLDAGCGDGSFLLDVMHGMPSHIRVEDCVAENAESAHLRLQTRADSVSHSTADVVTASSTRKFDIVLALGIMDYETEWEVSLQHLVSRCRRILILDIPKRFTLHSLLRASWLKIHGITLRSANRDQLEELLRTIHTRALIVETPIQWIIRFDCDGKGWQ